MCWRCGGWNLYPLERRWEAIEACEREWRQAKLRYATANIGLARLRDRSELIRIGLSDQPEFAAWRYGERFSRRRAVARLRVGLGAGAIGAATVVAGAAFASGISIAALAYGGVFAWSWLNSLKNPALARLPLAQDWSPEVRRSDLRYVRLVPDRSNGSWKITTGLGDWQDGPPGWVALALLLPHINRWGGPRSVQEAALRLLMQKRDPDDLIVHLAHESAGFPLRHLTVPQRFALEMAVNEGAERKLLDTELRLLERAWKEAEQVAAIADSLLVPPGIERSLAEMKGRLTRPPVVVGPGGPERQA